MLLRKHENRPHGKLKSEVRLELVDILGVEFYPVTLQGALGDHRLDDESGEWSYEACHYSQPGHGYDCSEGS